MKINWSYLPNLITSIRLLLIYPILQAILAGNNQLAFYLLLIAGCSDVFDGQLARSCGWESQLGAFLDPLADKLLLMSVLYIILPWWQISAFFIGRDILIMLGILVYRIYVGPMTYYAVLSSKINTVLQFLILLYITCVDAIFAGELKFLWNFFNYFKGSYSCDRKTVMFFGWLLVIAAVITSIVSLAQYIAIWGPKAWKYINNGRKK